MKSNPKDPHDALPPDEEEPCSLAGTLAGECEFCPCWKECREKYPVGKNADVLE